LHERAASHRACHVRGADRARRNGQVDLPENRQLPDS
jgi:hypothetical protein